MTNETEISEALDRAMKIADDVVPERVPASEVPGATRADRQYYHALVAEKETEHSAYGEQLLAACRTAPVTDDGESYATWRARTPGHHGAGAMRLIRLWRAGRR